MEDAAGHLIHRLDLLKFKTACAHGDRGLALNIWPGGKKLVVLCADGTKVLVNACNVTIVDRSVFCPGFPVRSASDPDGQSGIVTGSATALDLQNQLDGKQTRGVSTAALKRATELFLGDYVVSGNWLGWVAQVSLDVDVLFEDGAVCRVTSAGTKLRALDEGHGNDGVFYRGQQVAPRHGSSVFKASRWIKGYWKPSRVQGTVAKNKVSGVLVHWLATSLSSESTPPPAYHHDSRNLTFFRSSDANKFWVVSNRCFFHEPTATTTEAVPAASTRGLRRGSRMRRRADQRRAELQRSLCIVTNTHTTVDVVWQDGTRQHGVPSASLVPVVVWNQHERIPGQSVIRTKPSSTAANNDDDATATEPAQRVGIVQSFNHKDVTACVSWFNNKDKVDCDKTLSAYDLDLSPDRNFLYGDVVVRLRATGASSAREDCSEGGGSTQEPAKRNKKEEDLSWVGHIVDLCDAPYIQVKWGDGNTSKVLLHEIAIVKPQSIQDMLHKMGDWMSDNENDGPDNAQAEDEPQDPPAAIVYGNNEDSEGDNDSDSNSNGEEGPAPARTMGWARLVTHAMIRLASNVLAKRKRCIVSGPAVEATENTETTVSSGNSVGHTEDPGAATAPGSGIGGDVSAGQGKQTEADAIGGDELFRFRHFDVVQSPPDHHYLDNMEQATGGGRKWIKRVQKEWKILGEDNLPETIYMRAFEDRMDLLRAVIVGVSGTPYHDGLFFFDLQLPPSYPAAPPLVSYRSFGLRLNPNLYESGTVCLRLLNTFGGEGVELWSPEASTVLQVLVSIQGLVLTALPYYNETGFVAFAGKPAGRRNELPYSENVFLLSLQTMLQLLRRPPAGFEEFVRDHFRRRGRHVLRACEAYLDGCTVGTLDCEARPTELSKERPSSAGFRLALANVVPRLVQVFKEIGSCE